MTLPTVKTKSLCPVCFRKLDAERVTVGDTVRLKRSCPDHGDFSPVVWSGSPTEEEWNPRPDAHPGSLAQIKTGLNCPEDCGICGNHRQTTCTALIEVTGRCNLKCEYCFADAGESCGGDPDLQTLSSWFKNLREVSPACNVQLSGGEPTMRDDLPEVIAEAKRAGIGFLQLNTNGLRLGTEPDYAAKLADAGLSSVFLQFDGTGDGIYRRLRGKSMLAEKLAAINRCGKAGLGVVLVPTVVKGVNDGDLGNIIRLALCFAPYVRGVHFQPVSHFGRCPDRTEGGRLTLPETLAALVEQSDGLFTADNFAPPSCEHPLCSFHGKFVLYEGGMLAPLTRRVKGVERLTAEEGARKSILQVAAQWRGVGTPEHKEGSNALEKFVAEYPSRLFTISAMAFMDSFSIDLERARSCCIHVVDSKRGLVPFCLHYLTSTQGKRLESI